MFEWYIINNELLKARNKTEALRKYAKIKNFANAKIINDVLFTKSGRQFIAELQTKKYF